MARKHHRLHDCRFGSGHWQKKYKSCAEQEPRSAHGCAVNYYLAPLFLTSLYSLQYFLLTKRRFNLIFSLLTHTLISLYFSSSAECEQEIQWLKEAGFDAIVKKYNGKIHIHTCVFSHGFQVIAQISNACLMCGR